MVQSVGQMKQITLSVGKKLAKPNGRRPKIAADPVDFLVWLDIVDKVPAEFSGEKLGISRQAIDKRRAKIRSFMGKDTEMLAGVRGAVTMLAVDSLNTLHYHITVNKDKDLAIRILENVRALERVNADLPVGAGVSFQQFFNGLSQVSDADRNRIRGSLSTAVNESGFGG